MKKLYIHIGVHKTGTTSIQNQLLKYRYDLLKSNAFYIPTSGLLNSISSKREYDSILVNRVKEELYNQILKFNSISSFITSSEHLSGSALTGYDNSDLMVKMLSDITSDLGCEIKIIIYIRRQDKYVESLYSHMIEGGYSIKFDSFISDFKDGYYDWNRLISSYEKFFGMENILVRSYDEVINKTGFFKDFCSLVNIPIISDYRANVGSNIASVELQRICNEKLDNETAKEITKSIRRYNRSFSRGSEIPKNIFFSLNDRKKFLEKYSESNNQVCKRFSIDPFDSVDEKSVENNLTNNDLLLTLLITINAINKRNENSFFHSIGACYFNYLTKFKKGLSYLRYWIYK